MGKELVEWCTQQFCEKQFTKKIVQSQYTVLIEKLQ